MSSSLIRTSHDLGAECPDPYISGYLSSFSVFRRPLSPYSMSHQLAYTVPCLLYLFLVITSLCALDIGIYLFPCT
jgi:hypothetical protein